MRVFKECNTIRAERIITATRLWLLECALIFCLTREATVAGLEVRARDVGLSQLVEARIDAPGSVQSVPEGYLAVHCPVEAVVTSNLDAIRRHLGLVLLALVVWRGN